MQCIKHDKTILGGGARPLRSRAGVIIIMIQPLVELYKGYIVMLKVS